jgi:AraC-like DNA-binding protein
MEKAALRISKVPLIPLHVDLLLSEWVRLSDWHYELRDPFWRIYWMAEAGWYILHEGKSLALDPRHLVVIPPNTPCRSESRKRATQFYVHFTLEAILCPYKPGVYFLPMTPNTSGLIKSLVMPEAGTERPEETLARTLRMKELCYDCLSRLPAKGMNLNPYSPRITLAMEAMVRALRTPLSNAELAKTAGMNTNAFIRLFTKEAGQSPQKWYTERRLNQAALLLSHSAKTIEEIAEETAFFDRNHFSRVFKRFRGVGPAAYRRQLEIRR